MTMASLRSRRAKFRPAVTYLEDRQCPSGSWTTLAPMPTPRFALAAAADDSRGVIYAVGGDEALQPTDFLNTVESYSPATNSWTNLPPMQIARNGMGAGVVNGVLYVLGGNTDYGSTTNTVDAYNPTSNSWSFVAPMLAPKSDGDNGVAVVNGRLYVIGGGPGDSMVQAYDPATDTWTEKASMPHSGASAFGVAALDGIIYVVGGANTSYVSQVDAYDPATNTWTSKAPMQTPRANPTIAAIDGRLYAVGGQNSANYLDTVEVYDPATDSWTSDTSMPATRTGMGGAVLDGVLYALGGRNTYAVGSALNSNFAFTPGAGAPALSSIQGLAYVDFNNDGQVDFGESGIVGLTISLSGADYLGHAVEQTTQTDANGVYSFTNVLPSDAAGYTITESQPAGYLDGRDTAGTINGIPVGSAAVSNVFSGLVILQGGSTAENYNFGERPTATGNVTHGQTAGIGFWQNKNGQNLIQALNGGAATTQLGHWLAATFPNMYASLDGMSNSGVAGFYKTLFSRNGSSSPGGPPKTDAQIMATALAVYVTNQTLAGNTATAYGFQVTADGVGSRTFNVGTRGAALGAANNSFVSVMDLLLAVNARSHNGLLYDMDSSGQISSSEAGYRTMANDLFSAINEAGGI